MRVHVKFHIFLSLFLSSILYSTSLSAAVKVNVVVNGPGTTVGRTLLPSGDVIIEAKPNRGASFTSWTSPLLYGVVCIGTSCTVNSGVFAKQSAVVTLTANFKPGTAYLLLHGLNSNADTWQRLVDAYFNKSCTKINNGIYIDTATDNQKCFRVNFQTRSRVGLENVKSWLNGDGATYTELGAEVTAAVGAITRDYPGIESVILVGHSRGGLAGRAALRDSANSLKKVKGLLTIGTPHQGSAFGRIYDWLASNPRPTTKSCKKPLVNPYGQLIGYAPEYCTTTTNGLASEKDRADAWGVADFIKGQSGLDVRAPSIGYLAIGSKETDSLTRGSLPSWVKYGWIASDNVKLGDIHWAVDLFGTLTIKSLPESVKKYILNNKALTDYLGDGIVHVASQRSLPNACAVMTLNNKRHTSETDEVIAIKKMLDEISNYSVMRCVELKP